MPSRRKRQEQQPDDRVEDEREQRRRPAQHQQDQPEQELRHPTPPLTGVYARGLPRVPVRRAGSMAGCSRRCRSTPTWRPCARRSGRPCGGARRAARARARRRACRRRSSRTGPCSCCSRGAWPRARSRGGSRTSRAGRSARRSAGRCASSAATAAKTRLLVATEGVLTRRLQSDPLLAGFRTIVLDEFHERSVHADLAIALARQAWRARDDLRLLVMSATLDAGPVARFLDDCPVVAVAGRPHPIEVAYEPGLIARGGGAHGRRAGERPRPLLPARRAGDPAGAGRAGRARPRRRRAAAARHAHGRGAGPRDRAVGRAQADPGHERRRDVADRRGRDGRDRHRPAQGAALRRRAGPRPAGAGAHPRGLGRAARRARRTHRPRPRAAALGSARSPAAAARARDRAGRPRRAGARGAGLGRRPDDLRVVRGAAGRAAGRPRCACWSGSARSTAAG